MLFLYEVHLFGLEYVRGDIIYVVADDAHKAIDAALGQWERDERAAYDATPERQRAPEYVPTRIEVTEVKRLYSRVVVA